jgi:hypothetical protein
MHASHDRFCHLFPPTLPSFYRYCFRRHPCLSVTTTLASLPPLTCMCLSHCLSYHPRISLKCPLRLDFLLFLTTLAALPPLLPLLCICSPQIIGLLLPLDLLLLLHCIALLISYLPPLPPCAATVTTTLVSVVNPLTCVYSPSMPYPLTLCTFRLQQPRQSKSKRTAG